MSPAPSDARNPLPPVQTPPPKSPGSVANIGENLLFGILALQNNFINRNALLAAFNAWVADKSRTLGSLLVEQRALDSERHDLLNALVRQHITIHDNDPEQSLASMSSVTGVVEALRSIADPDLEASLRLVATVAQRDRHEGRPTSANTSGQDVRYHKVRPHAKGGLGEVFVARDTELNREVALKEIQTIYADDPWSRTRFVAEAEVTGGLEHPGIVPVYGLGHYANGRPFYAMRFIKGDSLKDAIDQFHRAESPDRDSGERILSLQKLLRRFLDVCDAIEYAHSRGILHRDLKPHNVMVGKYGETLVVDWGLAKSVDRSEGEGPAPEATLRPSSSSGSAETLPGSVIGTPAYMSPEQAAGRIDQLGPASDVYSLGATLYALLTGKSPFFEKKVDALLEQVQRGEFLKPSAVVRWLDPALEAVCLKAMALRPEDRYHSPRALANDIERWIADEPVSVRRETYRERARRWARRNRTVVTGAAVAVLAGLFGLAAVAALQARYNDRLQRALGETRDAKKATEGALAQSEESRKQAEAVTTFLVESFRSADPAQDGNKIKVVDLLDRAVGSLDKEFGGTDATRGALLDSLGETYLGLGLNDKAVATFSKACGVREAALGADHPDTLTSRNNLGMAHLSSGRTAEAIARLEETLRRLEATLGPDHLLTLTSRNNLAMAYWSAGRTAESIRMHEETLRRLESALGPDHPYTLGSRNNLAMAYQDAGRTTEAVRMHEETLKRLEAKVGLDHPNTLSSRNNLANAYAALGRTAEAIRMHEETLKRLESKVGLDHPDTLNTRNNLANAYEMLGRWADAEPLERDTLARRRQTEKPDSPHLADDLAKLGWSLLHQAKWSEAETVLRECLAIRMKAGADDWSRFDAMSMLGEALLGQGKYAEAESLLVPGFEGMSAREATITAMNKPRLVEASKRLLRLYEAWGKPEQAAAWKLKLGLADLPPDVFARP